MIKRKAAVGENETTVRLADEIGLADLPESLFRIAIVTEATIGTRMEGPGIRAFELARILAKKHEVVLLSTDRAEIQPEDIEIRALAGRADMLAAERWCDALIFQGFPLEQFPWLYKTDRVLICDLYDPFHLEQLEQDRGISLEVRNSRFSSTVEVIHRQLKRGDFFICASDKQRDFWLGHLSALGRINPLTYDDDEMLNSLISVVPFGISREPPKHSRAVLRDAVSGISAADKILLWAGGLYPWLDPHSVVRAAALARDSVPELRLIFLAGRNPSVAIPKMKVAEEVRSLAQELDILGTHVFLVENWVPYEQRQNYLLEADAGVSAHRAHLESTFSFRTRLLDYIWTALPMITTGGDSFSEVIEEESLGITVPPDDPDAMAAAMVRMLKEEDFRLSCRARLEEVAPRYYWDEAARPLLEFCRSPRRAPDLVHEARERRWWHFLLLPRESRLGKRTRRLAYYVRQEGWWSATKRVFERVISRGSP